MIDPSELPTAWANYISMGGFLLLAVLVWMIPQKTIFAQAPDHAAWRDIRLWASLLICIQLLIYIVFA